MYCRLEIISLRNSEGISPLFSSCNCFRNSEGILIPDPNAFGHFGIFLISGDCDLAYSHEIYLVLCISLDVIHYAVQIYQIMFISSGNFSLISFFSLIS